MKQSVEPYKVKFILAKFPDLVICLSYPVAGYYNITANILKPYTDEGCERCKSVTENLVFYHSHAHFHGYLHILRLK